MNTEQFLVVLGAVLFLFFLVYSFRQEEKRQKETERLKLEQKLLAEKQELAQRRVIETERERRLRAEKKSQEDQRRAVEAAEREAEERCHREERERVLTELRREVQLKREAAEKREVKKQEKLRKQRESNIQRDNLPEVEVKKIDNQPDNQEIISLATTYVDEKRKRLIALMSEKGKVYRRESQVEGELKKKIEQFKRKDELDFCENQTEYSKLLDSYDTRINFDMVQTIAKKKVFEFTDEEKNQTFAALRHGTAQLQTKREMYQYLSAYGKMHRAKLDAAFDVCITDEHYLFEHNRATMQIIDYGCGQAIGTVCFVDYMTTIIKRLPNVTTVRLIEPSEIVLKRGVLHVKSVFKGTSSNPKIHSIHNELDNLQNNHLITDHQSIKFHIFSNILDVDTFSLDALCSKIASTQKGKNYFICVSPKINDTRNQRIDDFCSYFRTNHNATLISARESDIGTWKRYERVFSVNLT